jgi:transposase
MNIKYPSAKKTSLFKFLRGETPNERRLHRLHAVALVLQGVSIRKSRQFFNDAPRSVASWVKQFKEAGVEGLNDDPRTGRPSKLTPSQLNKLQTYLASQQQMTGSGLSRYLKREMKIALTARQCSRLIKLFKV